MSGLGKKNTCQEQTQSQSANDEEQTRCIGLSPVRLAIAMTGDQKLQTLDNVRPLKEFDERTVKFFPAS